MLARLSATKGHDNKPARPKTKPARHGLAVAWMDAPSD
jgi:hypothetical protein